MGRWFGPVGDCSCCGDVSSSSSSVDLCALIAAGSNLLTDYAVLIEIEFASDTLDIFMHLFNCTPRSRSFVGAQSANGSYIVPIAITSTGIPYRLTPYSEIIGTATSTEYDTSGNITGGEGYTCRLNITGDSSSGLSIAFPFRPDDPFHNPPYDFISGGTQILNFCPPFGTSSYTVTDTRAAGCRTLSAMIPQPPGPAGMGSTLSVTLVRL